MTLTIDHHMDEEFAVFELEGSLTLGPSLVSLRNAAREMVCKPKITGIILDVGKITSVDSSGLGELTIVYSSANRHNCPMRLVGVNPNLKKMLEMTHLDGVLTSSGDLATAKRELKKR